MRSPRRPPAQTQNPPRTNTPYRSPSPPYQQQTAHRPPAAYGGVNRQQPLPRTANDRERLLRARETQTVTMQVQCCVPAKRRRKRRAGPILIAILCTVLLLVGSIFGGIAYQRHKEALALAVYAQTAGLNTEESTPTLIPVVTDPPETEPPGPLAVMASSNGETVIVDEEIQCTHAVLIDVANAAVLVDKKSNEQIYPASMTKVMTLIVAYEHLESFDLTYTFTADLINPLVEANASRAGFFPGETVPVIDLLYGAALPSGADATSALAELIAGSEEAFVELMNQKATEMGLSGTHFVNASGLHDDAHYSTLREIAAIFSYAMQIEPLRKILSTYQYTTTEQNPGGILLTSTLFSGLSGDEMPGIKILAGKTGYTLEAHRCLVSMAVRDDGREFIAVVVGGESRWTPITDSMELYARCLEPASADTTAPS